MANNFPYGDNKVVLPSVDAQRAKNYAGDKETTCRKVVIAFYKGEFHTVVDARWYMGKSSSASVVYCSVWASASNRYISGTGKASGYGYHKPSAALEIAMENAGCGIAKYFGGCGDNAENHALLAFAKAMLPRCRYFTIV